MAAERASARLAATRTGGSERDAGRPASRLHAARAFGGNRPVSAHRAAIRGIGERATRATAGAVIPAAQPASAVRAAAIRHARVGDLLPPGVLDRSRARRIDATALLLPGAAQDLGPYRSELASAGDDLAAWDGRCVELEPDGRSEHRLLVVDRYGQVYDVRDAPSAAGLPSVYELEEWFRYLATACPECGVLDDPAYEGPTP